MVFLTVLCGVAVYVVGQMFLKLCAEPAMELRASIGEIAFLIALRSSDGDAESPGHLEELEEASDALGDAERANALGDAKRADSGDDASEPPPPDQDPGDRAAVWLQFRAASADLTRSLWTIPLYKWWADAGLIPRRDVVEEASRDLLRVSDYLRSGNTTSADRLMKNIAGNLLHPKASKRSQ